jgi:hypothetical protein
MTATLRKIQGPGALVQAPPAPRQGMPSAAEMLLQDMQERIRSGVERFGEHLQIHNGRNTLIDAYHEALDLAAFMRKKIAEQAEPIITDIYLDMDDTIVDFTGGACKAHGFPVESLSEGDGALCDKMNISPQEFWAKCSGHDFWAGLEWHPQGGEIMDIVSLCAVSTWLITSPSDDPGSCSGKYAWLQANLPGRRRNLVMSTARAAVAAPGRILIDDRQENCEQWEARGGEAILIPRPNNRRFAHTAGAVGYLRNELNFLSRRFA